MTPNLVKKIHIIDDDPLTLQILLHLLSKSGYNIKTSLSGPDAFLDFESYCPDLILLDVIMPQMDGYQVCRMLKNDENLSHIPVIFITSSHDTTELIKGFDAGAVDFISKPVNKSELLARVNTHLELKNARDLIEEKNVALSLEIDYRRHAEEKFRALSETTFEAILFLQNNEVIESNSAAFRLLGLKQERDTNPSIFSFTDEKGKQLLQNILRKKDRTGPWEITFFDSKQNSFYGLVQYQSFLYQNKNVNVLAIRDITRQKEIDKEIFNAIMEAEENERKRFSRDMHDGLGALLSTLKIYVNLIQKDNKDAAEKEMLLNEMKDTINKAVESARTIANNIMPSVLMDHGLIKALKSFMDALNKTGIIEADFRWPQISLKIEPNIETHLYRIVLELINNTLKYAGATTIKLEISYRGNHLQMHYADNGKGFDFEQVYNNKMGSQGLKNILSRLNFIGGDGNFQTKVGEGLKFYLNVPL